MLHDVSIATFRRDTHASASHKYRNVTSVHTEQAQPRLHYLTHTSETNTNNKYRNITTVRSEQAETRLRYLTRTSEIDN
jgi:hypothetical protein